MSRTKPQRSPEQFAQEAERLQDMQQPAADAPAAEKSVGVAATLHLMRGLGETVFCAGRSWNVSPFTLKNRDAGFAAVRSCHALLVAEVLAGPQGSRVPIGLVTEVYNRVTGRATPENEELRPFTTEEVTQFLVDLPAQITDDEVSSLLEPILINLRRHQPDVVREDLEDDFDLSTFVEFLRAIMRQNTGLLELF